MSEFYDLLLIAVPFVLLDLVMRIVSILDIYKQERAVKGLSKLGWTLVVLIINYAWIVYFLGGRDYATFDD